eukprot:321772-Alexandrium_andersonii.AAC.1
MISQRGRGLNTTRARSWPERLEGATQPAPGPYIRGGGCAPWTPRLELEALRDARLLQLQTPSLGVALATLGS